MFSPGDIGWIFFRVESDLLTIDHDSVIPGLNFVGEPQVGRVVFDEVLQTLDIEEGVIDTGNVKSLGGLKASSEYESANSA